MTKQATRDPNESKLRAAIKAARLRGAFYSADKAESLIGKVPCEELYWWLKG